MRIQSVRVRNFRCILDETLKCEPLTTLVGPNGCGKSTFIRAIDLFYAPSAQISADDFYNRDASADIEISIVFCDLTPEEKERFRSRMHGEELPVVRVFSPGGGRSSGKYFGVTPQNPDFIAIRSNSGRELLNQYSALRSRPEYKDALPIARSQAAAIEAMEAWEQANKSKLQPARDDGQFFGFENVARGYLGDVTRFLFIPAVRDAADDAREGRNSAITQLMDLVVRATLSNRREILELKQQVQERYAALTDPATLPELGGLAGRLSRTLNDYYRDTEVALKWFPPDEILLPPPKADVRIVEGKFDVPVGRTGHGLQRAFILTLLQHLALARIANGDSPAEDGLSEQTVDTPAPMVSLEPKLNLILAIEEPELYQHPSRQRVFARVLFDLAYGKIPGVAAQTQIIYATHSPLLVGIDRFDQVRRVRRDKLAADLPKVARIVGTTWDAVAEAIWVAEGSPGAKFTGGTIRPRVAALMTPWLNEGFFADVAVLVEGEDDRAVLLGAALARGVDLEGLGCSVIPCGGKGSLDRPATIFRKLEIAVYLIWDSDQGAAGNDKKAEENSKRENRRLLRIVGAAEEDWPRFVGRTYACFEKNLETTLRDEIGRELFDTLVSQQQTALSIPSPRQAVKNPVALAAVLTEARNRGKESQTLNAILNQITDLRAAQ